MCRGALFNKCILSCVLIALVYIHNTITWIQMWKQCVVFLQQTVTSKYNPSRCSFTSGGDNCHTKTKNNVAGRWPATSWVHYTTSCNTWSSAPEDGQNNCPKHVELTGIINKPLLLYLVGCPYYLYQWYMVKQMSMTICNVIRICRFQKSVADCDRWLIWQVSLYFYCVTCILILLYLNLPLELLL